MPEPKADQALPSHLAMLVAGTPPAVCEVSPSVEIRPRSPPAQGPLDPSQNLMPTRPLPSHLADVGGAHPLAVVKRSPSVRLARSPPTQRPSPFIPEPKGRQVPAVPFGVLLNGHAGPPL